ncbi:MAG TPA: biotin--[acetyl-CoA-carboxylase] ligase [Bauldia sp.]|nr:biotin--[acetyl-CoA-carboxylase] ligase [Bauldia sp.]
MAFALSERARQAGHRILSFDEIGSTNAEALQRAREGERGPLWVVARRQTAGRGRRGREWQTLDGNLAATFLRSVRCSASTAATLSLVAGLAVLEALQTCAPGLDVTLKWPNDVTAGGAKLAGILLESESLDKSVIAAIGIGTNVATAPTGLPYPATSIGMLGRHVTAEQLFSALTAAWIDLESLWSEGRGMETIRSLWLRHAAGLGARIAVQAGNREILGIFDTIDSEGRLIVRTDDGALLPIVAGEVHFARSSAKAGAH